MPEIPAIPRFDGARAWALLKPQEQARIGAIALELAAAWRAQAVARAEAAASGRDMLVEGCTPIERAAEAADLKLVAELEVAALRAVPQLAQDLALIPSRLGMVCDPCGCSEFDACVDPHHPGTRGCCWVASNRCSACAPADAKGMLR